MIYEVIAGEAGSGKTNRLLQRAAIQVEHSPVVVIVDETCEQNAFETINDYIKLDTNTFEFGVYRAHTGMPFNAEQGLKACLIKGLEEVPDATHVFLDVVGAIPYEVFHIIGDRELVFTKQVIRGQPQ